MESRGWRCNRRNIRTFDAVEMQPFKKRSGMEHVQKLICCWTGAVAEVIQPKVCEVAPKARELPIDEHGAQVEASESWHSVGEQNRIIEVTSVRG